MVCCRFMCHTSLELNLSFCSKINKIHIRLDWNWHEIEVKKLSVVVKSIDGSIYLHIHRLGSQLFVSTIHSLSTIGTSSLKWVQCSSFSFASFDLDVCNSILINYPKAVCGIADLFICLVPYSIHQSASYMRWGKREREREQVSHIACRKQLFDVIYLYTSLVFQW